jgi:hypothetical protein
MHIFLGLLTFARLLQQHDMEADIACSRNMGCRLTMVKLHLVSSTQVVDQERLFHFCLTVFEVGIIFQDPATTV